MNHPAQDPQTLIDQSKMSAYQVVAVCICIFLYALDGFDVLSISFAAPGIAAQWGIERAALGVVLSMELFGMALGSIFIGRYADSFGRKPTTLACLVVMAIGMGLAAMAQSITELSIYRFTTGVGIGGMLAITTAMVAEYSNAKNRYLCITLMGAGYPLGAVLGGSVASVLLQTHDWRAVFLFGAIVTGLMIPVSWLCLPESIAFLNRRRPEAALQKINKTLEKMKISPLAQLPPLTQAKVETGFAALFSSRYIRVTLLLALAYFFHIMTFYFILKWIPKIVVDMGFSPSSAGGVLVWANVGGVAGSVLLGMLTWRLPVRVLVIASMIIGSGLVWLFGSGQSDLQQLSLVAAAAGFFITSAVVGMYSLFANYFPAEIRAGGTGFVIGLGRGGAALGPIIAGVLFQMGLGLEFVAICMAVGSIVAALAIVGLPKAR
jgi:benzoate transport